MNRGISQRARYAIASPAMLIALAMASPATRAQEQVPAPVAAAVDTTPTPYAKLLETEPAANAPYTLGRGDMVSILVEGRPELTSKQAVGPDGSVTLPLIGSISIVDKTRDEAAEAIHAALLTYYTHPVVTVSVEAYNSNRILLVGAVAQPGVLVFDHTPTLLEVLARGGSSARSGGLRDRSGGGNFGGGAGASSETLPDQCVIYRGADTVIRLDLRQLVVTGSPFANLRLKRDDTVYVPTSTDKYISVLGQVQRPGSQSLDRNTTLVQLLADAGGLTPQAGKNPTIEVINPSTGRKRNIEFKALLKSSSSDVRLESGDVIFIPQSGFNAAAYTLEQLSPLVSIFTTAALLNQR